jgi:hypothetical protein
VVPLARAAVHRVAVPSSPERRRRRCPPCAAVRRRRRHGMSLLSSHARARRFVEGPASIGAAQRRFPLRAAAHLRSPAAPRAAAGRAPPPAACSSSGPPDIGSTAQSESNAPVKANHTGQPSRIKP